MLTTILPGLRDLRTPLATGYLFLALLWMWFGSSIPEHAEATGLLLRIYETSEFLGVTSTLAALTFIAYIVGAVLSVKHVPNGMFGSRDLRETRATEMSLNEKALSIILNLDAHDVPRDKLYPTLLRDQDGHRSGTLDEQWLVERLAFRIRREFKLLATRLHASSRELFDDYDRASSEAEFRASAAVPSGLILASVPFIFELHLALKITLVALGAALIVGLAYRSILKQVEANNILVQVLAIGFVKSPTEEFIESLIDRHKELEKGSPRTPASVLDPATAGASEVGSVAP